MWKPLNPSPTHRTSLVTGGTLKAAVGGEASGRCFSSIPHPVPPPVKAKPVERADATSYHSYGGASSPKPCISHAGCRNPRPRVTSGA